MAPYREKMQVWMKELEKKFPGSTGGLEPQPGDDDAAIELKAQQAHSRANASDVESRARESRESARASARDAALGAESIEIDGSTAIIHGRGGRTTIVPVSDIAGVNTSAKVTPKKQ